MRLQPAPEVQILNRPKEPQSNGTHKTDRERERNHRTYMGSNWAKYGQVKSPILQGFVSFVVPGCVLHFLIGQTPRLVIETAGAGWVWLVAA